MKLLDKKKLWSLGYVELWNFSKTNSSQEAREEACALIGGACRNVTIKNPKQFYQRLLTEHNGKPSEILQFIPFISDCDNPYEIDQEDIVDYYRFGYINNKFFTNFRNYINYYKDSINEKPALKKSEKYQNNNFIVFRIKIPYMIVDHLRRHKLLSSMFAENWQSNRSKHDIEYFENDEIKIMDTEMYDSFGSETGIRKMIFKKQPKIRQELVNKGEFGLRYVTGWIGGWLQDPAVWDNFFGVRTKNPTQKETQELSRVMLEMLEKHHGYTINKY